MEEDSIVGGGSWKAVELFDQAGKPDAWDRKTQRVTKTNRVPLHLVPRGGFVAEITKD